MGFWFPKHQAKPKGLCGGLSEVGETDGFKALLIFDKRFDIRTSATLLQAYMEVINIPLLKNIHDVVSGIHNWEARMTALENGFGESEKNIRRA